MITVDNLTKRYPAKIAIEGVSFQVEKGEILGFLGPNGAGKTTTMRIVTGFMPASDGTVSVDGFDVFEHPIDVRRRIGYLPENPPLYVEMSVAGYLRFVAKIKGVPKDKLDSEVKRVMDRVSITDVAKASFQAGRLPPGLEGGLYETGTFAPDDNTYPNGCHVCEVEIDPDTGALEIVRYVVIDDVGTVVNPIGLKGQIHGGVAQGLGQALMEQVVYDRESGQNLTGSFMDYCMPRADTMPYMEITSNPVPTKPNPLGAKGAGEAGTVGALPAIVNAVVDALAPLGVKGLDMPATSERIWQAMRDARA